MKTLKFILCLLICTSASGQGVPAARAAICTDLSSAVMSRMVRIGYSHSFSSGWSAEGRMEIPILMNSKDHEAEREHNSMLTGKDDSEHAVPRTSYPYMMIGFRYWPGEYHDGVYLGFFCTHGHRDGTDMAAEFGYAVRIWKHLGMELGYCVRLIEGLESGIFNTEGIRIGIDYIF